MGKTKPYKTNLYTYLESTGVLEHGTNEAITLMKHRYWKEYRREWKRNKRRQSKTFEIQLTVKEERMIAESIRQTTMSMTRFIKQAAIACCSNRSYISRAEVGELRELLTLTYHSLQTIVDGHIQSEDIGTMLLQKMLILETKILDLMQGHAMPQLSNKN